MFNFFRRSRRPTNRRSTNRRAHAAPLARRLLLESLEGRDLLAASGFVQQNLVGSNASLAPVVDDNLVNPWGMAINPISQEVLTANNGSGTATLYSPSGTPVPAGNPLIITIPPPPGSISGSFSTVTGVVFNPLAQGFNVTSGSKTASSLYIFDAEDGVISGWSPSVDATNAVIAVDNSTTGAVYKGLAFGNNATDAFIYAADFGKNKIEVYDKDFKPATLAGSFTDPQVPAGFAPFNIENVDGRLFVTYAKQDDSGHGDVPGPGNGYLAIFDTDGNLVQHAISGGALNSPWGVTQAPALFGAAAHDILVGNFGDGKINRYDPTTFAYKGTLNAPNGQPIVIGDLWALQFGGTTGNQLYFTSGVQYEADGLLGRLTPADQPLSGTGVNIATKAGQAFTGPVARFTDADGLAKPADFQAVINWGDGTAASAGTVTQEAGGTFVVTGSHTYAAGGSFAVHVTVTDTDTSHDTGGSTTTITSTASVTSTAPTNESFLNRLYVDLLGRALDPSGRNTFLPALNQGVSRLKVVQAIQSSREYLGHEVDQLYMLYLHRHADDQGLSGGTNFLLAGGTVEQLSAAIFGSGEYFQRRAGNNNDAFLANLYVDIFGRQIDAGGKTTWSDALAHGVSRSQVAAVLLATQEHRQVLVGGWYSTYLHRPVDASGLNTFTTLLRRGVRDEAVIALLVSSPEYFNLG